MFSPELQTAPNAASTRNPRRRQRGENDSVNIKQPTRKRSKLSQETFANTNGVGDVNGVGLQGEKRANGSAKGAERNGHGSVNLAVREKQVGATAGSKRGGRPDTSTILTRTSNYAFKQLPALPEQLKNGDAGDYHAYTQPGSNYALALTRAQALIWDYTSAFANPTPRIFTFPQPFKATDPLPLGTLITSSASTDLGLVLVGAKDGSITFWENIEFADTAALFQQRQQGVQGHVKLVSSETVVELVDAQHAGYLLRLSGGRLAHFSIRDQQGRPAVAVALLEGQKASGWGLRNIFQGSWQKRDLAAVKARPASRKSYVDVTAVTRDATITEWDISWDGKQNWRREINVGSILRESLQIDEATHLQQDESVYVLDFVQLEAPLSGGNELVTAQSAAEARSLLLFVAIQGQTQKRFALVELLALHDQIAQGEVFAIAAYKSPAPRHADELHAKILLPDPGHTALIVTDDQVLIVGISAESEHRFQDTLSLKQGPSFEIIGLSCEERSSRQRAANCLLATKSAGIVRVSLEEGGTRDRLSPRAKFEQAVYFGHLPDNFLKLGARPAYRYANEDVEQALVNVSHAILESHCDFLPPVTPATLEQIEFRSRRLRDLSHFMIRNYPDISREVRWRVLWDAEKIESLYKIWQAYEKLLAATGPEQPPLLQVILERTHQKGLIRPQTKIESKGLLMQWFATDGRSVEKVVQWTYDGLQDIYKENAHSISDMLTYIHQADEIAMLTLGSALKFRQAHAADFGLGDERLEQGLLLTGYEGLPELWTSRLNVVNGVRQLTDFARAMANFVQNMDDIDENLEEVSQVVAQENVGLVDLSCRAHVERTRWLLNHGTDEAAIRAGVRWETEFKRDIRPTLITGLTNLGQASAGMTLAERFHDLDSLAVLTLDELRFHDPDGDVVGDLPPQQRQAAKEKFDALKNQVQQYFVKYGVKWAETFYSKAIEQERYAELLDKNYGSKEALTKYLHANESRAGLAWINDISNNNDLLAGVQSLFTAANETETNTWCQNVELSLATLASLAIESKKDGDFKLDAKQERKHQQLKRDIDSSLKLSRLQQRLYNHIQHETKVAVSQDQVADLLLQTYAPALADEKPALGELLKHGFDELANHRVMSPALLIDVLTLIQTVECEVKADDISGKEFLMALQVLDASGFAHDENRKAEFEGLARLIWKRCFTRNDWTAIVMEAEGRTASEVLAVVNWTAAFETLKQGNLLGKSAAHTSDSLPRTNTRLLALWDTSPAFQPLAPSTALNALSTAAELTPRFGEDIAAAIAADNAHDDAALQHYVTDDKLDSWFATLIKLARQAAMDDGPAARDVAERRALLEFIKEGFREPD